MAANLAQDVFWPNALASFVGAATYREMVEEAYTRQEYVSNWNNHNSVWTDPAANPVQTEPWAFGETGKGGISRGFLVFLCNKYSSQSDPSLERWIALNFFSETRAHEPYLST